MMRSSSVTYCFRFMTLAKLRRRSSRFFVPGFVLLLFCTFGSEVRAQSTELTVEDYCRLTISLMQVSVEEWQERVPVAEKIRADRRKLESGLEGVTKKFREQRTEKLKQFGISQQSYLNYSTEHKDEIESFLEDNPEVREAIDSLQKQIDKLIEQFESAASPHQGAEK